jgi:flagellar hook-associated protein 1 FlgK
LSIGAPAPTSGERFLLQPVTRAANSMTRVLGDPRGIAAASAVTATLATTNTGTASVAALRVADPAIDPTLTADISFTSDTGDYSWTLTDAGGATVSSGTGTWTAGAPIALNGFELQLAGVPKNGDAIAVAPTAFPAANNGNALALLNLRDGGIVAGSTVTDAYASAMADIGVRVQGATTAATLSSAVATEAKAARDDQSGVNLDEEAARLIQYQHSYQAAARILQVAQSLFTSLLEATR